MTNDDFFQKMINDAMPNMVITNYVVVAEVVTENGTDLQMMLSRSATPWLASGMLEFASDMLFSGQHEFFNIDEEEE
jgi:hypothetical protein